MSYGFEFFGQRPIVLGTRLLLFELMASGHQLFKIPRLESVPDEPIKRLLSFASMLALWHDGYMNDALSAPLSESLPIVQIEQLVSQLDVALPKVGLK